MTRPAQLVSEPVADHARLHPRRSRILRDGVAIAAIGAIALVLGGLTSPAQQFLPDALRSVANSSSGWSIPVFLLVWLWRLRPVPAIIAGPVAFVLMVEGYRIASEWRGFEYGAPFSDSYTFIGLVVGPILGLSASLLRYGRSPWRTLAIAPLAIILIGEGVYGLTVVADSTSPVYWSIVIALGVGATVLHLWRERPPLRLVALTIAVILLGSAAFWVAYSSL